MSNLKLPQGWRWSHLSEVADVINGVSYNGEEETSSGIRILRGGNIQGGELLLKNDDVYVPEKYRNEHNNVKKGDIIMVASTGSLGVLGKAAPILEDLESTQIGAFLRIIRPKNIICAPYVSTLLTSVHFKKYILALAGNGTGINNIRNEYLEDFPIPLPEDKEMPGISAFLDNFAMKQHYNSKLISEVDSMLYELYHYWFVQFEFPDTNGNPYKSGGGSLEWNEDLRREIPSDWSVVQIKDVLGKVKNTPKLKTKEYFDDGEFPIIDQAVDSYFAGFSNRSDAVVRQFPAVVFGDHSCAVKYVDFPFVRGADGTQVMLVDGKTISVQFLYYAVKDVRFRKGYARHFAQLKDTFVVVPEKSLMEKFSEVATQGLELISQLRKEKLEFSKEENKFLPLILSGQIKMN